MYLPSWDKVLGSRNAGDPVVASTWFPNELSTLGRAILASLLVRECFTLSGQPVAAWMWERNLGSNLIGPHAPPHLICAG